MNTAAEIRARFRRQRRFWQRIPYLALMADGRPDHDERLARAYKLGCWAVPGSEYRGYFRIYIDLASGELVDPVEFHESGGKPVRIPDDLILRLRLHLEKMDPAQIVRELKKLASQLAPEPRDRTNGDRWRTRMLDLLGIREVFTADQRGLVPLPHPED